MPLTLAAICVGAVCLVIAVRFRRARAQQDMERHSITPEALHTLLDANKEVLLFDVRQPLDLLVSYEIIPGAKRVPPKDVLENPSLIPADKDSIVYCTCPSDKTSRAVLGRALDMHFSRIKFLKGGLEAWKAEGYPVEQYNELIHLDIAT
jgi:rhodanese-related sulfurtransferase